MAAGAEPTDGRFIRSSEDADAPPPAPEEPGATTAVCFTADSLDPRPIRVSAPPARNGASPMASGVSDPKRYRRGIQMPGKWA